MIALGQFNKLEILRHTSVGLFLGDDTHSGILLPNKYVPENYIIGEEITVFCYLDHDERPVATTLEPHIIVGEFQLLKVVEVNEFGAFLDWGLEKHLLVPFSEQRNKMQEGQWYVVHCYLDERSNRLVASNKIDKFLSNDELTVRVRENVELVVTRQTDLGWEVIVNNRHKGLVYFNEVFKKLAVGDVVAGCIKAIRRDNKIDVSLQPLGLKILEPAANKIYDTLLAHKGFLALNDRSDPETIKKELQMSKKTFKKGIGTLYKERKIEIKDDGIYIVTREQ
ncbi:MAG: S1 RNA-binding domain-containing protein [Flavobacteriaceae bacterium]